MRYLRKISVILIVSIIALQWSVADELIIQHITVISPQLKQPLANASVRIRDDRIAEVTTDKLQNVATGAMILDGAGRYIIPGLMDSHIHTSVIPGLGFSGYGYAKAFPELSNLYEDQLPRSLLYFGVTQVIDVASIPATLERFENQSLRPDIFYCGAAPTLGGYPMLLLGQDLALEDFPYFIIDPDAATEISLPDTINPAEHTPQAVVKRMHEDGARCVKIFVEDGFGPQSHWPVPDTKIIKQLTAQAHELGMPVLAHANALGMQQKALAGGIDVLAHGLWNWGQDRDAEGLPESIRQHLDLVIQNQIGFQPTLRVLDGVQDLFEETTLSNPVLTKTVPGALLDWYRTEEGQWFKNEMVTERFGGLPDQKIAAILTGPTSQGERVLQYLAAQNYPLLLASDLPANPGYGNQPGLSTYQELEHMASLGVPMTALFEAATINNAKAFGLDKQYGTIEEGKIANLLLLSENPLENVKAYRKIDKIILHGKVIDRESLVAPSK